MAALKVEYNVQLLHNVTEKNLYYYVENNNRSKDVHLFCIVLHVFSFKKKRKLQSFHLRCSSTTYKNLVDQRRERWTLVFGVGIICIFPFDGKDTRKKKAVKEGIFLNYSIRDGSDMQ